jgi:hypothetical protein
MVILKSGSVVWLCTSVIAGSEKALISSIMQKNTVLVLAVIFFVTSVSVSIFRAL